MACLVVPAAEAAIVTIVHIVMEHKSKKALLWQDLFWVDPFGKL